MDSEHTANVYEMVPRLTVGEAARLLQVHSNTLRRWSDRGIIPAYHIGPRGDRRYMQDQVECFLSQLRAHRGNPREIDVTLR